MLETLQTRLEEVFSEGGQTRPQELQTVFKDQLLDKGEGEILLHPLANHPDLHPFEILQGHCDEVRVIAPEVVEKAGILQVRRRRMLHHLCAAPRYFHVTWSWSRTLSVWLVLKGLWQIWHRVS